MELRRPGAKSRYNFMMSESAPITVWRRRSLITPCVCVYFPLHGMSARRGSSSIDRIRLLR
eukprot:8290317-Lingulodinium_polyedra.AAC.1